MRITRGLSWAVVGSLAIAGALAAACGDDDDDDASPTTVATRAGATTAATQPGAVTGPKVNVGDNVFSPGNLTVKVGEKLTWTWAGSNPHSVIGKFDGQDVNSRTQTEGNFEFTFSKAGTFDYQCGVHGASMAGKITVQ